MQVVGQQHPRINSKRFLLADSADRFARKASSHKIGWATEMFMK